MRTQLSSRLFLLFPLPLISFTIVTMFLDPGTLNYDSIDFIGETLFLGSTHNYLSAGVFLLPAASTWLAQRASAGRQPIGLWSITIISVLFSFFIWRALSGGQASESRPTIILLTDFLFTALSLHHTLWQVKGVSLTYVFQSEGEPSTPKATPRLFKNEHTPFYLLLALVLARPIASTAQGLFPGLQELLNLRMIGLFSALAMLSIIGVMILPDLFKTRGWYNLRLASWALIPVSRYGFIVTLAVHGIEYFFVILQIFSRESRQFVLKTVVGLLTIAIAFRVGVAAFNRYQPGHAPLLLMIVNAAALTIGVAHFYWDRVLFAMREPETRAFTGTRLLGKSKTAG